MCVNARSPLEDGIGDSQCGGFFPAELKFAGFDGIVFTGKAPTYQYLWIHDGEAELRDQWIQHPDVHEGLVRDLYVAVFPSAMSANPAEAGEESVLAQLRDEMRTLLGI